MTRSLLAVGVFTCLFSFQAEAGACSRWLSSAAVIMSLSAGATGEVISLTPLAQDRILFEPSTYFRDPREIIDFREPESWLFSNDTSYLYSSPDQFRQSFMIYFIEELDRDLMPEEAQFGLWADYTQMSSSSNWYSYRIYDYWAGQVMTYRWYLNEPLSGPRPIILDDGGFYVSNPIPAPETIGILGLAGIALLRNRSR